MNWILPTCPVTNKLLNRIVIDSKVCGGKPCLRGTRIWVSLILDLLADGMTEAELFAEYPQLAHEDVLAAIACGAARGCINGGSCSDGAMRAPKTWR